MRKPCDRDCGQSKEAAAMPGPGIYMPDATEGVKRVEDLPKPIVVERSRNYPRQCCPKCGKSAGRLRTCHRTLHELGEARSRTPARSASDLFPASLQILRPLLQRRHAGSGRVRRALHPPRRRGRRAVCRRGRHALPDRLLAFMAGPTRLRPLGHDPELGRGGGEKKASGRSSGSTSTKRWQSSPGTSPSMNCTMARSAC